MIDLSAATPFATGDNRACYAHPADPTLCIKVDLPGRSPRERYQTEGRWYRPRSYYDESLRDAASLQRLPRLYKDAAPLPFPRFRSWLQTSLGRGLAMDLIRDADGQISKTLAHYIRRNLQPAALQTALEQLADFFATHGCVLRSMQPHNTLVRKNADNTLDLVIIDNLQINRLASLSKPTARRRTTRVMDSLAEQIEALRRQKKRTTNDHQ